MLGFFTSPNFHPHSLTGVTLGVSETLQMKHIVALHKIIDFSDFRHFTVEILTIIAKFNSQ